MARVARPRPSVRSRMVVPCPPLVVSRVRQSRDGYPTPMDRTDWWRALDPGLTAPLGEVWIPVGSLGFSGDAKARRRSTLDDRFGADGWRYAHVVRGEVVPPSVAILEYEASYRRYLRDRPALVRFLVTTC